MKYRIAIMTQPLGHNYGGILQNFALTEVIKSLNHEVITINRIYQPRPIHKKILSVIKNQTINRVIGKYHYKISKSDKSYIYSENILFMSKYINISEEVDSNRKLKKYFLKQDFDVVIVGSDQTWRPKYSPSIANYFLDFIKNNNDIIKIAYATSFGTDFWEFTENQTKTCKDLIEKFNAISVREKSAIKLCKDNFGVVPEHVLDPVLLLNKEKYLSIIDNKKSVSSNGEKGGLFSYILDNNHEKNDFISAISSLLNLNSFKTQPNKKISDFDGMDLSDYRYPSIEEWLSSFSDAEFIVTDSFHGTVLSIIFEKPFITIINKERGASRFESFLSLLGLNHRMIYNLSDFDESLLINDIDYNFIKHKIADLREVSIGFLKINLHGK